MTVVALEIIFIFLLLLLNGLFAMIEIAVVSSRKSRLRAWAETGDARAKAALDLVEYLAIRRVNHGNGFARQGGNGRVGDVVELHGLILLQKAQNSRFHATFWYQIGLQPNKYGRNQLFY